MYNWILPHLLSLVCALGVTVAPFTARGADGVIEINAVSAATGGITPGDAPGLPVTISESGSFILTGSLVGPGIEISLGVTDVTVDLNGFSIDGSMGGNGGIIGGDRVTVRNGIVENYPNHDCVLLGRQSIIIGVTVRNCQRGIMTGFSSIVLRSLAESNAMGGITSILVAESTSVGNGGIGIVGGSGSVVIDNVARNNGGAGILGNTDSVVTRNAASGNGTSGIRVPFGGSVVRGNSANSTTSGPGILAVNTNMVQGNTASSNGGAGITCGRMCNILENTTSLNAGDGIVIGNGSSAIHNVSSSNAGDGIQCEGSGNNATCGIVGNLATGNTGFGLLFDLPLSNGNYKNNTFNQNGTDVSAGTLDPGFQNTCSGGSCP